MQRLDCTATEEEPDFPDASVGEPQFTLFWLGPKGAKVVVHFMENGAYLVTDPHAVAVGPEISLRYVPISPSGAAMGSVSLRKLVFHFPDFVPRKYQFSLKALRK